jgi:hypothetical protein
VQAEAPAAEAPILVIGVPAVRFIDRRRSQCCWPLNGFRDRDSGDMPVCGKPVAPEKPYCPTHAAAAFRPAPKPRKTEAAA